MNSTFFNIPIWQQYLICVLLTSTLFFIGYQFVIRDLKQQADQQMLLYEEKNAEIKILQAKIERYQMAQNSSLTLITEHKLAKAIDRNQLRLTSFKHQKSDLATYWEVELNGQFVNFMQFIADFNHNFYYLNFQNLSIAKQDTYLQIRFSLLFKEEDMQ